MAESISCQVTSSVNKNTALDMGHWAATGVCWKDASVPGWHYCIWQLLPGASCSLNRSASAQVQRRAKRNAHFTVLDVLMQVKTEIWIELTKYITCSFLNRSPCVLLFPCFPCFAFQNCFWAEYLFMGHTLKRQSGEEEKHSGTQELFSLSPEPLQGSSVVKLHVWGKCMFAYQWSRSLKH